MSKNHTSYSISVQDLKNNYPNEYELLRKWIIEYEKSSVYFDYSSVTDLDTTMTPNDLIEFAYYLYDDNDDEVIVDYRTPLKLPNDDINYDYNCAYLFSSQMYEENLQTPTPIRSPYDAARNAYLTTCYELYKFAKKLCLEGEHWRRIYAKIF